MELIVSIKRAFRRVTNYDLVRFHPSVHAVARQMSLMRSRGIDLVFDVGANEGQYGLELRREGYRGAIVSFEPVSSAFAKLQRRCERDPSWKCEHLALGKSEAVSTINISKRLTSSSLLPMRALHVAAAPASAYIGQEQIRVAPLDQIAPRYLGLGSSRLLKIDTQGYERQVLDGAQETLSQFNALQLEMSLQPLYEGAPTYLEMLEYVASKGFQMVAFDPVFSAPATGQVLQFDALFFRDVPP